MDKLTMDAERIARLSCCLSTVARSCRITADALDLCRYLEDPSPAMAAWAEVVKQQAAELYKTAESMQGGMT